MKKILVIAIVFVTIFIVGLYLQSSGSLIASENLWSKEFVILGGAYQLVDLMITSILSCTIFMIILLLYILFNRTKLERREKIKEKLLIQYQNLLVEYIFDINKRIENEEIIRLISTTSFRKQLLIDQLIDVSKNLSKDKFALLRDLYLRLNLQKLTFKKLKSIHWHIKVKGFKELYEFNITEKNKILYKYINSRNDILRMEAQIALVDLSQEYKDSNPFEFLTKLTYPFSLWEQITLHQVMIQREITPPNFGKFLFHSNDTVVMFALRMIKEYNQVENHLFIENLVYHTNEEVIKLALEVMGHFKLSKNLYRVRSQFKKLSQDNKLQMITSMKKCSTQKMLGFLQLAAEDNDVEIQIEAIKAIKNIPEIGEITLKKMMESQYRDYDIFIKHVLDNRI